MRILLDHCAPRPLRRYLLGHTVHTARELRWEGLRNGALLDSVEDGGYELLITTDQGIRYQQNISDRRIAILVLLDNRWPRIRVRLDEIRASLEDVRPGEVREVPI